MIYPCPYCDTELNLQPEHIGRRITCPACNQSFVADDLPPVTIAQPSAPQKSGSSFGNVFKIVLYVFLAILLIGFIWVAAIFIIALLGPNTIQDKVDASLSHTEYIVD